MGNYKTACLAVASNIKLFFTDEMAVLFVLLTGDHHLVVVGVVSEQLPALPGVAHRTETQTPSLEHQRNSYFEAIL